MISVLVVDECTVLRDGLRLILQEDPELQVVGEAAGGEAALAQAKNLAPDVVIIDHTLSDCYGFSIIQQIKSVAPQSHILILTNSRKSEDMLTAFKFGVKGYLLKAASGQEVKSAVRQVALGQAVLPPALTTTFLESLSSPSPLPSLQALTKRELDVLQQITKGLGNKEIASVLSISQNTVKTHIRRILSKLHLRSRTQAAAFALQNGLFIKH